MAQDSKDNPGFVLPPPDAGKTPPATAKTPAAPATPATPSTAVNPANADHAASTSTGTTEATSADLPVLAGTADTSSRDLLVGGAILLVLFIGFFFARGAYANALVVKRVSPNKANAAGWWLFVFLASVSTGVVLAAVNAARFMTPLIIGPILALALLALVLTFVSSRR